MSKKELIAKILESLSEEEIQELLEQKSEEKEDTNKEKTSFHQISKRGKGRSKKSRRKTVAKNDQENRKNSKRRSSKRKSKRRIGNSNGRACRVLPMDLDSERPNLFEEKMLEGLTSEERRELTLASESDKKAKQNFKRSSKRKNNLIWVECVSCGEEYEVSSTLVSSPQRWRCNDCCCTPRY